MKIKKLGMWCGGIFGFVGAIIFTIIALFQDRKDSLSAIGISWGLACLNFILVIIGTDIIIVATIMIILCLAFQFIIE